VLIQSPVPDLPENATVLAAWTFGLGKSVAWTTDAGTRWTQGWNNWSGFDKLLGQMVRWSMRPSGDDSRLNVATETADGRVNVVVTALDKEDRFVDFLELGGSVIGPDMK